MYISFMVLHLELQTCSRPLKTSRNRNPRGSFGNFVTDPIWYSQRRDLFAWNSHTAQPDRAGQVLCATAGLAAP